MAVYTSPKTWNVGDVLTASDMNVYVRDNTLYFRGGNGGVIDVTAGFRVTNTNAGGGAEMIVTNSVAGKSGYIYTDDSGIYYLGLLGIANFFSIDATNGVRIIGVTSGNMRPQRHPYASDRHMESGAVNSTSPISVTYTDAFSSSAQIVATGNSSSGFAFVSAIGTSGATLAFTGGGSQTVFWIAEGPD